MPTKSAGRVSIRVLPDSSRFRDELKLSLERIEKTMKANIPANLVVTRESILRLKEQIKELQARIKIEPYVTDEQLHELKRKIEGVDPRINANLNALNAQRRLATISRDREVTLFVKVNKASAAAAAQTLAALSGARLVGDILDDFWNTLKNLDKNAPKLAAISSGILAIGAAALAGISNVAGLAGSFAELGKVAVLGPALFSAVGISVGVLIAAFKDTKKVLADLAPAFHQLQDVISAKFWGEAAGPIRHLTNTLLPGLKASLGDVSQSWGRLFGKLASEIEANVTPQKLAFMMGNLSKAIDIAGGAMKPLVHAFSTLGTFGSNYLPRLADWLVKISTRFDDFIAKADADGRLTKWAEAGIKAVKDLGDVLYQTGRVFVALNQAAKRAGGAGFEDLAGGLKKLSDLMRTEGFQKGFETIFAGAHKAMDGLFDGIKRLGPGLEIFAVTLNTVFGTVGKVLGQVGEDISAFLSSETLNQGLKDFFSGFLTFVTDLKPAMGPIGDIIGTLGSALGVFLSQIGPLLADVAKVLAPLFKDVWEAIKPLIPDLVKLADTFVKELGPPLTVLVKEVLPPLIPIIKDLIPVVKDLIVAASPVLITFFKELASALRDSGPEIHKTSDWMHILFEEMRNYPKAFFQASTGDNKGMMQTLFQMAIDHPELPATFRIIGEALGGIFGKLDGFANGVATLQSFMNLVSIASNVSLPAAMAVLGLLLTQFKTGWDTEMEVLRVNWQNWWNNLPAPIQGGFIALGTAFSTNWNGFTLRIATALLLLSNQWSVFWQNLPMAVALGIYSSAQAVAANFMHIVTAVFLGMINVGTTFARGWQGIRDAVPVWFNTIATGVEFGIAVVVAKVFGLPNRMIAVLMSYLDSFRRSGASLIGAFAEGITSGVNPVVAAITAVVAEVAAHLPHSPAKKGPLSGRGYPLYSGRATVEAFAEGMRQRTGTVQRASYDALSAVQLNGAGFSTRSAASGMAALSGSSNGALVNIEGDYYGATPERVAAEFDTKLRRANLVAQLGKVSK